ncbi:MAG: hypothetical protein KH301_03770 [Brachyspira sp.]|nr:hypothetical protein [Brachyspira sp.]
MLLFFVSLVLVIATSGFLTAVLQNKKFISALIYFLLISFTNVVITFELLSLFSAISKVGVLCVNTLFTFFAFYLWKKVGCPKFEFNIKKDIFLFFKTLLKDKYILVLALATFFMCGVSLWLISFMPVVNPDAEGYHVLRSLFWISNHNLNHFNIADARCLDLPINSEILYAWVFLFVRKCVWFGIFSFSGFILAITALFGILTNLGLSLRKRLWVLFITSSFASVIVQISGTETDIIVAGLVLASIYLYWHALKVDSKVSILMSALAYALAIGTKTPALILVPGVGLWMLAISFYYKKKDFYKPFLWFLLFSIGCFFLVGAYNYILNFIDYKNIAGSESLLVAHKNHHGFKSVPADFVKYLFMFFDFTGFTWNKTLGVHLVAFRDMLLSNLGFFVPFDGINSTDSSLSNNSLIEPLMGLGVLGFLVYLPCFIISLIRPVITRKRRDLFLLSFALIFVVTLLTMAYEIQFMTFSIRFFTAFCVVSAPVLVYSYTKKNTPYKFIVVFFALFYLLFVSTHLWARAANRIFQYFRQGATITQVREIAACSGFFKNIKQNPALIKNYPLFNSACGIRNKIRMIDKNNKILYFANTSDTLLLIKQLNFEGYNIDFNVAENIDNIDPYKYNLIVTINDTQFSTNVLKYNERNSGKEYVSNGVVCGYLDTNNQPISVVSNKRPYKSVCRFTDYFFRKYGYRYYNSFIIDYKEKGETQILKFTFYENVNNPVVSR